MKADFKKGYYYYIDNYENRKFEHYRKQKLNFLYNRI
jgi:hypothetical protein